MTLITNATRRDFLRFGARTLGSAAAVSTLGGLQNAMAAVETTGYKALVCIFLEGGNDGFNMVVPSSGAAYNVYSTSRRNMALAASSLLPIAPRISDGNTYGLHPKLGPIQTMFQNGTLALVANVGALIQPTTASQYKAGGAKLPPQLFSHIDQSRAWMTSMPGALTSYGWGGRVADLLAAQGYGNPQLATNISMNGDNIWSAGAKTAFYTMGDHGAPLLIDYQYPNLRNGTRKATLDTILADATNSTDPSLYLHEYARTENRAITSSLYVSNALASAPALRTVFPGSALGQQLSLAAQMINLRSTFGLSRQMFFVRLGALDFHNAMLAGQETAFADLGACISAFYNATVEMGVQNSVTGFTMSEFGRTLSSNGDGTDHGWGSHHMVFGGAVKGKAIYGTMPNLVIGGPDDADSGRIVPTLSTDQYAATLSRWYGVADTDLNGLFPNLPNFATRNLGFV